MSSLIINQCDDQKDWGGGYGRGRACRNDCYKQWHVVGHDGRIIKPCPRKATISLATQAEEVATPGNSFRSLIFRISITHFGNVITMSNH